MALDTNSTMVTQNELKRVADAMRSLIGTASAGQGSAFAPRLVGSTQVPTVEALRVTPLSDSFLGSEFLLTWEDLPRFLNVDRYNVYAKRANDLEEPKIVASVGKAPCRIRVGGDSTSPVTFWVQTQLKNGFASPRELSSTVTGISTQSQIEDDDIASVSIGKLLAGTALFTGTATFQNGSYLLEIASTGIRMSDGTRNVSISGSAIAIGDGTSSVVINSSGNIVLTKGTRSLNLSTTSISLSDGTASITINSSNNIVLSRGAYLTTISGTAITMSNGTQSLGISSTAVALSYSGGRFLQIDGTQVSISDGTGSLVMTGSFARFSRGTFVLDLTASYVQISDGTNYNRITSTQQILNGGQIVLNGTAGTDPIVIQSAGVTKLRVTSGGDIQFSDDVQFGPTDSVEHGDGAFSRVWQSSSSGFDCFVDFEVVNSGTVYRHNGNAGITGTRTALDSGSVSRTVTISGGIITGWTT